MLSDHLKVTVYYGEAQCMLVVCILGDGRGGGGLVPFPSRYLIRCVCARCVTNCGLFAPDVKAFQQSFKSKVLPGTLTYLFLYYQVIPGRPPGACSQRSLLKTWWTFNRCEHLAGYMRYLTLEKKNCSL